MITKRLYVGGLSHNISKKDLKDRFGKFGEVSDVEVVTRKDEDGNPVKTFGYININLSDAELTRCMTVLNKSKWKGGTLQIEIAKESFLHRLAVERQQAAENARVKNLNQPERLVDSLKKVGVENFHMKAAVPGTEIPEHKDWIVSKFGRVLPILNLKCEGKSKSFKYDPSKHCHNIKKLDTVMDVTEFTSVSQLTWEIPGGDDEISKKRRGEFPPQKPRPKKIKQDLSCPLGAYQSESQRNPTIDRLDINNSVCERLSNRGKQKMVQLELRSTLDSSNEMVVTTEASQANKTDDGLEVVGDDFIVRSIVSQRGKRKSTTSSGNVDDQDYDSADTDEILTRSKAVDALDTELNTYSKPDLLSEDGEESDGNLESDSSIESDYESMMTNCSRLEISLGDLELLAKRFSENSREENANVSKPVSVQSPKKVCINPEDILASILGTHSSEDEANMKEPKQKKSKKKSMSSLPAFMGTKGLFGAFKGTEQELNPCITMHNSVEEQKPNTVSKSKHSSSEVQAKISHVEPPYSVTNSQCINPSINVSSTEPPNSEEDIVEDVGTAHSILQCSASQENLKDERNVAVDFTSTGKDKGSAAPRKTPVPLHICDSEKQRQDNERRLAGLEQRQRESAQQKKLIQGALAEVDTPYAHRGKHIVFDSDNENDVEEDCYLSAIRGNNLSGEESEDAGKKNQNQQPKTSGACRLFDSSEEEEDASDEDRFQIKPQFEGKSGQRLMELQSRFGADERFQMNSRFMESEEEDEDEEQLNKTSGISAYGDGNVSHVIEEKLVEEKKKNLEILQSVLSINKQPGFAERTKSKIFRDVSSLHYDPSREDHAAFEKSKVLKTEGKATRQKKLADAEKLPEVSKDIFYDVAVDLKEVFGSTSTTVNGERDVSWDKKEDEKNEQSQTPEGDADMLSGISSLAAPEKVESAGFKFSFFGADTETVANVNAERDEYKIEPLTGPKVSWQVDPRFQDSSSDDEDTEENEGETNTVSMVAVEYLKPSKKMFFFYLDDDRLKEGPILFCRPARLEDQREEWEEKRSSLIEEYRKKHRAARKKMRESYHN